MGRLFRPAYDEPSVPWRGGIAGTDREADGINLGRVEWVGWLGLIAIAVKYGFSLFGSDRLLPVVAILCWIALSAFTVAVRVARRRGVSDKVARLLPQLFVTVLLLMSATAGHFIAQDGRLPGGFAIVVLALSAVFMIPPRRFVPIALATYGVFLLLVFPAEHSLYERLVAAANTGIAVAAAIMARIMLYRLRERERVNRLLIAEQNRALTESNRSLAERNAELAELVAIAAHDLRSPLFGLRNLLALAAGRNAPSPEMRRVLDESERTINAMLTLVGRIVEAHEVEHLAGIVVGGEDLHEAAMAAAARNAALGHDIGVTIEPRVPPYALPALADRDMVGRVLDNLVANAVRFAPPGSVVLVEARCVGDRAMVAVVDSGPGVPPADEPFLFEKFRRGSNQPAARARGSGLGLYISSKLVAAMQGDLRYRPGRDGGAIFELSLRRCAVPGPLPPMWARGVAEITP